MNEKIAAALIGVLVAALLYWLAVSIIEAYFRRKEQFVDKIHGKLTGEDDGPRE